MTTVFGCPPLLYNVVSRVPIKICQGLIFRGRSREGFNRPLYIRPRACPSGSAVTLIVIGTVKGSARLGPVKSC